MHKLTRFLALGIVAYVAQFSSAANLLLNANLDDPGNHEVDLATSWTLQEFKTTTGPGDTATFASFANHTPNPNAPNPDPDTTRVGVWYKNFTGTGTNLATAHLYQDVPGTPGLKYVLTGWSRFETFYAGGFNQTPSIDPITGEFVLMPSPTKSIFAIDFLGAGDAVISSVEWDLHDQGGQINNGQWVQHMVMGIAPPGTVEVRARSSAIDMIATFGAQSAFADDFVLEGIPEPASMVLGAIAALACIGFVRRRSL
jgi:hypothetical protein